MRYQTAKTRDENGIAYIISSESTQTEKDIMKYASEFYGVKMIAVERRTNIGK